MLDKKICMIGAPGVGKTSLVRRFVESLFSDRYHSTIGVKVDKKVVHVDGRELTLLIWDLEGMDELSQLPQLYLRGAAGFLLVVDGTRRETLDTARVLREGVEASVGPLPYVVLQNKSDLTDLWAIGDETPLACPGAAVQRTSAKTGAGVQEAFRALSAMLLAS